MKKNEFEVFWSGHYPCFCRGEWSLFVNGKDISDVIPKEKLNEPMNIYNIYNVFTQKFDSKWHDIWEDLEDGLKLEEWAEANPWAVKVCKDYDFDIEELYNLFKEKDWRHGICGGCV